MEATRRRILDAALDLISERGYNGATTAEIARRAGVAEGTIYRYFKDKKELFIACVEPVVHEALSRERALPRSGRLHDLIRLRIRELVQVMRENQKVFNVLFTEGRYHPEIADILLEHVVRAFTAEDRAAFARAVKAGAIREPHPVILTVGLAAAVWAMLQIGPGIPPAFAGLLSPDWYDRLDEDVADFFTDAILAPGKV
ncbi:MAG: TetR/AcrR family transcriptional regulator [Symbiobacterium sp.]|mgnify:CR=1 FL=1|jgi:Bacterial regulatory proteins, tetR family.|uniref:TetR/AcrR family transcriptional regulator n=1 Tax=Symbiobacterium sp. TaxID=1971213 RepID=UPI00346450E5